MKILTTTVKLKTATKRQKKKKNSSISDYSARVEVRQRPRISSCETCLKKRLLASHRGDFCND